MNYQLQRVASIVLSALCLLLSVVAPAQKPGVTVKPATASHPAPATPVTQPKQGERSGTPVYPQGLTSPRIDWIKKMDPSQTAAFVENNGQYGDLAGVKSSEILYGFKDGSFKAFFTRKGMFYQIIRREKVSETEWEQYAEENKIQEAEDADNKNEAHYITRKAVVGMNWENANPDPSIRTEDPTSFYFNFYDPYKDKNRIIGNVKGYKKIVYSNIYPHIDLEFTLHPEQGFKYAFILHPGADASMIRMHYGDGELQRDGDNLIIRTGLGNLTDHAPQTYTGSRTGAKIESGFQLLDARTAGFSLPSNLITEETIIDPWTIGPPTATNESPCDISTDPSNNSYVYSDNPTTVDEKVTKYNSAGVLQWTLDVTSSYNYSKAYQGDIIADQSGNFYINVGLGPTTGAYYNTCKINTGGNTLLWGTTTGTTSVNHMYETWTLAFKCDYSLLVQTGGGLLFPGFPFNTVYYNVGVSEPLNTSTGAEGTLHEVDTLGEIYSSAFGPNGMLYHLSADSNSGSSRTGAASTGAHNRLSCVNPSTGYSFVWKKTTGYSFKDGDLKAPGSVGMNAIAVSCNYVFTTDGLNLDSWNVTTGAHGAHTTVPGGSNTPNLSTTNSGILVDKCGNVYVGSNGHISVFDANLNLINTISGLPQIVFDMAWGNSGTQIYFCGGSTAANSFVGAVSIPSCNTASSGLTVAVTQPSCVTPTGSATANPTFCGAPYTYSWSPGGMTTQTVSGLSPGTYTLIVSGSLQCPYSYADTTTITINSSSTLSSSQSITNVTCNAACNGTATVNLTGGTAPFTYTWSPAPGAGQGTATASSMCNGTYTCTVHDAGGCTTTQVVTITQPSALSVVPTQTNVACNGASTGSATATVSGGTTTYTYSWSPSGGTGATASGLAAGTYTCTIHDANGCTATQIYTITQPSVLSVTPTQTNVACNGASTGSATATVSGGTSGYTYSWSPSGGTGATASGLAAGTYTCTIHDANGCVTTHVYTITQPSALSVTPTQTNISCNGGTGSATATVSGGTTSYTYSWSPSGGTGATASGLAAGTYTCTIHDANGCLVTQVYTITQPSALSVVPTQTNILCNGASTGSATATVSGGTTSYTYAWTPSGGTAATASGLAAGTYTCTIHDANGCVTTQVYTITQPAALNLTPSSTNTACGGNTGSVTVAVSGGTGSYTYSWNPTSATTATVNNLPAGTYTCTVTDGNGCVRTTTANVNNTSGPTATLAASGNATCNGSCNGSASVSVSGGLTPYTYSWSPSGGTSASAVYLCAGSYVCTITDANGCVTTQNATVTQPSVLSVNPTQTNVSCNGGTTGSATATLSGGTGSYTYSWSPSGGTGATASGLSAGTYTCTIHDANGCTTTHVYTITQPSALSVVPTQTNVSCNGGTSGTATATVSGGTAGYTYSWSPSGGTAATASGLAAGTYTCTIHDANGCATTQVFTITQPSALSVTPTQTNISCNGGANGSATATVSGGTSSYTYSWSPSGGTAATASGLSAGTYTCTVTDANGCTTTHVYTITQPSGLSVVPTQTNVSCNGGNTGTATATVSGGTSAYTYSWSPSGGTAATASGLAAGTYTVNITDANGCTTSQVYTITEPSTLSVTPAQTDVSCSGGNTGSATATVSGGTAGYTYSWAPSGGTGATASGLAAGTYTCTIHDANGCTTSQVYTITQPTPLSATSTQMNVNCNSASSGSATVNVSGGTTSYTYSWSPSGGNAATAGGLAAGTYTCTISDANGCTTTQTVTITQPSALSTTTSQTNVACNGAATGSATVNVTGGTSAYTYSWSPTGTTTATTGGLTAGTYSCSITDANGCTTGTSVTITEPPAIVLSGSATAATCGGSNGTATCSASGGTGAYTYSWSPAGGASATASGLSAGTYTCTVTDANGCTQTVTASVNNTGGPSVSLLSSTNVNCSSSCNGSATVSASGGTGPYTYSWTPSGGTAPTEVNLCPGSYNCSVTDANGCVTSQSVTITSPAALAVNPSQTNVSCNGGTTGSATATVTGGTGAYTYSWIPSGGTAATASGLSAGTYTCSITDANGCTTSQTFTITEPPVLAATTSSTNTACAAMNGSVSVTATGGTGTYSYSWSPGGATTATVNSLGAGTYTCVIQDGNGCMQTVTATVNNNGGPTVSLSASSNVTCNAACNGSATVSLSGGTGPFTYSWSPSGGTAATATTLCAGNYTCTVVDANGCLVTQAATITQPAVLAVVPAQTNVTCNGSNNGTATATVSGGTGTYTYSWSPAPGGGQGTANATGLTGPTTYTCAITDANGCTTSQTYTISQPALLTASSTVVGATCGQNNGSATTAASGGTGTLTYSWSPSGGTAATASSLGAGTYTCTVTDANGCTTTTTGTITNTGAMPVAAITAGGPTTFCAGGNVTLTAGGTGTYSWSNGSTSSSITATTGGTYTLSVTNSCGTDTATQVVTVNPLPTATITGNSNICAGDSTLLTASGGSTYSWSTGATTSTIWVSASGNYTVTSTNACGTATATQTVTSSTVTAGFTVDSLTGYAPLTDHFTNTSSANAVSWSWNFGDNSTATGANQSHVYTSGGTYTVTLTVTNSNGCTSTQTTIIVVKDAVSWINVPNVFTPNGDGNNDLFLIRSAGLSSMNVEIFDRWGLKIYVITTPDQGWDGRMMNGNECVDGTYYYILKADGYDNKTYNLSGFLMLIRNH